LVWVGWAVGVLWSKFELVLLRFGVMVDFSERGDAQVVLILENYEALGVLLA
jgi:hypothetical protein